MEKIRLSNNEIFEIEPLVFDGLDHLKNLDLGDNKCKTEFSWADSRAEVVEIINRIKAGECGLTATEKEEKMLEEKNQQNLS